MAQITIMDGINILAQIRKQLNECRTQRQELSIHRSEKPEEMKGFEVDDLTDKIISLISDSAQLSGLIANANSNATITLPGTDHIVSLSEAMAIVKEWRNEIACLSRLATISSSPKLTPGFSKQAYYESATFESSAYKERAERLTITANSLSRIIDRANDEYEFKFVNADKYLLV